MNSLTVALPVVPIVECPSRIGRRRRAAEMLSFGCLAAFGAVLTVAASPAMADEFGGVSSAELIEGVGTGADLVPPTASPDLVAEAEKERARQRLLDYLQRLRSRPEAPTPEPTFPSFGSDVFDAQLAGYLAYVNALGTPDILIVGSSRALQGIDPAALQAQLAVQGYPGLKVYNFSVNGATAQVVNFVLSELLPGDLPAVVVWGDGSRAFNDGRRDRTWETITASPGYQAILRGERPMLRPELDLTLDPVLEDTPATEVTFLGAAGTIVSDEVELSAGEGSDLEESSLEETALEESAVAEDLSAAALSESNAVEERLGELLAVEGSSIEMNDIEIEETIASEIEETVASSEVSLVGTRLNGLTLDGLGFSAVSDRFDPARYYQQFPRVSGQYDGAYSPFALQGAQAVALGQAAIAVQRQNAQLIFVNLPLSDSYLDDFRLYYEDRFQQFLQIESDRYGFEVVDLLQAWQGQPDLFADPSHINQHGAAAIAAQLAFDPTLLLALRTRPDL